MEDPRARKHGVFLKTLHGASRLCLGERGGQTAGVLGPGPGHHDARALEGDLVGSCRWSLRGCVAERPGEQKRRQRGSPLVSGG